PTGNMRSTLVRSRYLTLLQVRNVPAHIRRILVTDTQPESPGKSQTDSNEKQSGNAVKPNITKIGSLPPKPIQPPPKSPAAPFAPASYSFALDTMRVSSLCSALYDDQDQIVASLTVNNTPVQPITYKKPGVDVGDHSLG